MRWVWVLGLLAVVSWSTASAQDEDDGIEIEEPPKPEDEPKPKPKPKPKPPQDQPPSKKEPAPAKFDPVSAEQINRAIERGVAWLKKAQRKDGSWGPCRATGAYGAGPTRSPECHNSGPTSFAVYTLAKCGVDRKDRVVKKAIKFLDENYGSNTKHRFTSYESASLILMLAALNKPSAETFAKPSKSPLRPPRTSRFKKDDWKWMHAHLNPLLRQNQQPGGGWRYWNDPAEDDLSATQFTLLALRAARRVGYPVLKVSPDCWNSAAKGARRLQGTNGAFRYQGKYRTTAGMGAAGLGSLLICKEQMQIDGLPVPSWIDRALTKGLKHLGEHWRVDKNVEDEKSNGKNHTGYHYYHLYGIERVGDLSGKREIGGRAWYPRGAAWLVAEQDKDGHWADPTCMAPKDVLGTCFALLFLKRATIPVVTRSGD
jgi:hypothetical protein